MTENVMFTAATDVDAAAIVGLRHAIWGTTYRGIYPDQMLDDFAWDWHREQELRRLHDPPAWRVVLLIYRFMPA